MFDETDNGQTQYCPMCLKYQQVIDKIIEKAQKGVNNTDCYERMYGGRMYCQPILDIIKEGLDNANIQS